MAWVSQNFIPAAALLPGVRKLAFAEANMQARAGLPRVEDCDVLSRADGTYEVALYWGGGWHRASANDVVGVRDAVVSLWPKWFFADEAVVDYETPIIR